MINYSIIIPHYNNFKMLERLLESIPFENKCIQVIVIDDCSDDSKKLEKLSKKYFCVEFYKNNINNKNAGASRNLGLKYALGKWLIFADSDDYFTKGAFEIIEKYKNKTEDIIYFTPTSIYEDTKEISDRHLIYEAIIEKYLKESNEDGLRYTFYVPWSKMIKRNLVLENRIKFDEVISGNDTGFSRRIGEKANKILGTKEIIYCVTRNKGSLTTQYNKKVIDSRLKIAIENNIVFKNNKNLQIPMFRYLKEASKINLVYFLYVLFIIFKYNFRVFPIDYFNFLKSKEMFLNKINKIIKNKKYRI